MTEEAWLSLTRPQRMLKHVGAVATERRLRLLMVACHRWSYPFQGPAFDAVLLAVERVADGIETAEDVAVLDALPAWDRKTWNGGPGRTITAAGMQGQFPLHRSNEIERVAQCNLIRCIFGNPFRPVALEPDWLMSNVVALAGGIYDEKAFDRMPILADALEDAGCGHAEVLDHCRGPGPHARGCHVLDAILGKP